MRLRAVIKQPTANTQAPNHPFSPVPPGQRSRAGRAKRSLKQNEMNKCMRQTPHSTPTTHLENRGNGHGIGGPAPSNGQLNGL